MASLQNGHFEIGTQFSLLARILNTKENKYTKMIENYDTEWADDFGNFFLVYFFTFICKSILEINLSPSYL